MRRLGVAVAVALVVFGAGASACSSSGQGVAADTVTISPLIDRQDGTCKAPGLMPIVKAGHPEGCARVGAPVVTAKDVTKATAHQSSAINQGTDRGPDEVLSLTLTPDAARRLEAFASARQVQTAAFTFKGVVMATPVFQNTQFSSGVEVSALSLADATRIVHALHGTVAPTTTTSPNQPRAKALCQSHQSELAPGSVIAEGAPTTAGQVTRMARLYLGRTESPWDTLPADHFVARCTYVGQGAKGQFFHVDEDGRTSVDEAQAAASGK
jgi:hypothetical protein